MKILWWIDLFCHKDNFGFAQEVKWVAKMSAGIVHPLIADNFIKQTLVVKAEQNWKNCVLLYNGDVVIKKSGKAIVKDDNGKDITVMLSQNFFQKAHFVIVDGQTLQLVPQFKWYELAWIWIPLLLMFGGGALGGLIGGLAGSINSALYRKWYGAGAFKRYLVTGLISMFAVVLYFVFGTFLHCWINPAKCPLQ